MLWTFEILWIYLLLERSDENMKKKIAIMLSIILMAGTFTACTAEEKVNNSSLSPTASISVGVSVSGENFCDGRNSTKAVVLFQATYHSM